MTVKAFLDRAVSFKGYHEGYNNDTPFGKRFNLNHESWCDMFLCCCGEDVKEKSAVGWYAGTESHEEWFKVHDHITHSRNQIERGQLIFWDWNKNGSPNHIEAVLTANTDAHGNVVSVTTIGGNTGPNSNGVYVQVRSLYYFLSAGKPQFSNVSTAWPGKMLVYGSDNDAVKRMQRKLSISDDGVFGKDTLKHVKDFQHAHKLSVDGEVGSKTWGVLF